MKIAYFDCFSGISGDMCLGAVVDAGVPLKEIETGLKRLKLKGYLLRGKKVSRTGFRATKVDVVIDTGSRRRHPGARTWDDIQKVIRGSAMPDNIKQQGLAVFKTLFAAEAKVHGRRINETHLHELGCVDCLVDIFGTLIGLSALGVETLYASPINLGSGTIKTSHGVLPVPAPATAELLQGVPCYASGPSWELTTPTGAAILAALSSGFGEMPYFIPEKIGMGAGNKDSETYPNLLRLMIGETCEDSKGETVTVIETNIDDMNPQVYEYVMERLFEKGALDVFLTQVIMKKSRPGTLLTVLCDRGRKNDLIDIILKETTSLGVRFHEASRVTMERYLKRVLTPYGSVRIKEAAYSFSAKSAPEYEDCKRIAAMTGRPLLVVMSEALRSSKP